MPALPTPDAGQRRGFALLSIMVAVVLLATAVMAIGAANTTRLRSQTISTTRTAALSLARDHLEAVRARDPWSVASEAPQAVDATGAPVTGGEFTRELVVTVVQDNLLMLEVIITPRRGTAPVRLITNLFRGARIAPGA
ncbi:MAG: hypothetical protein IT355_10930 [Gemmatimonadaceae bacterium]|nr:hypothetical protein [Gemmatimonadaceae bacterium]